MICAFHVVSKKSFYSDPKDTLFCFLLEVDNFSLYVWIYGSFQIFYVQGKIGVLIVINW